MQGETTFQKWREIKTYSDKQKWTDCTIINKNFSWKQLLKDAIEEEGKLSQKEGNPKRRNAKQEVNKETLTLFSKEDKILNNNISVKECSKIKDFCIVLKEGKNYID